MTTTTTHDLQPGARVTAARDLDPEGANVSQGTTGEVIHPANHHNDNGGPIVRWANGGLCNVYDDDVLAT